jgi:hypothetical protein
MVKSFHAKVWDLAICATCDEVFDIETRQCPSCTCSSYLPLSLVIEPLQPMKEIKSIRAGRVVLNFPARSGVTNLRQ